MRTSASETVPRRVAIKTDVSPQFASQIRQAAASQHRTVSNFLQLALRKQLDEQNTKEKTP
jgi:hypothetical protein